MEELRNSQSYIDAYAKYIKTGKDKEIRALLTANATVLEGTTQIPVPEFVYDTVKTAWEDSELLRYVRKLYVKGNLKVGFEVSSSGAEVHPEGGDPIQEEELQIGVVELVPEMVKKYVMLSDELEAMASRDFLMYVYDELTHQIALKLETEIINAITNQPVGVTVPEVVNYGTNPKPETIAMSLSKLCAEAKNPVAIMNRGTWGEFKKAQYEANYPIDVFEKLTVIFSDALKSFADASVNDPYLIVGDFENGFLMNYPEGDEIRIKRDDITLATQDLVRYVGRVYCAFGVIAPKHFAVIEKLGSEGRTKLIYENGTYDVSDRAKAYVHVTNTDEKHYLIPKGTRATSMELDGTYGIFLPNTYVFAPKLYFVIDGVEYETRPYGAVGTPSNTIPFTFGSNNTQIALVSSDYMGLGMFSGTGIITARDTEPTEHSISVYYKGSQELNWQIVFVNDVSTEDFKAVAYFYSNMQIDNFDIRPDKYSFPMGLPNTVTNSTRYVGQALGQYGSISNRVGGIISGDDTGRNISYNSNEYGKSNLVYYVWTA